MVHTDYDFSEFISVRYYDTKGQFGSDESEDRMAYYGVQYTPTTIFNGTDLFVGTSDTTATGASFLDVVAGSYFSASPIRIDIQSFDPVTGDITAVVTMYSPTERLDGDAIRFVLLEDDITPHATHVARDIVSDTISLAGQGNSATVSASFEINPNWDAEELHAVVFVQRQDKEVVQAAATYPVPDYRVRAVVPFSSMLIGPSRGTYVSDAFDLINLGAADTFTVTAVVDQGPPGWTVDVSAAGAAGTATAKSQSISLGPEESTQLRCDVTSTSPGFMKYHLEISSPNLEAPTEISFSYVSDDVDVLVVDDDGGESFEEYYTSALESAGKSYGVWNLAAAKLTPAVAAAFPVLIWDVGWSFPSLDAEDRAFLMEYLDHGNALFLSGQDIGWDLFESDDNQAPEFLENYIHAEYVRDDTNDMDLVGVEGDPITDGLALHIAGGDGADNQQYPSEIQAFDDSATEILYDSGGGAGAIRAWDSASQARVVYLAFGFEAIDNPEDRAALLGSAVAWLEECLDHRCVRHIPRRVGGRY